MSRDTRSDNEIAKALFLENVTGVLGLINDTIGYKTGRSTKSVHPQPHLTIIPTSWGEKNEERTHY